MAASGLLVTAFMLVGCVVLTAAIVAMMFVVVWQRRR